MSKKVKLQHESIRIDKNKPGDRYPVFCFRYLQPYSYNACSESAFFISFLERLKKLGGLGWNGINISSRHSFGTEKIPVNKIKPKILPPIVTEDVKELTALRANGNNLPFLGIRTNDTFQVVFMETNFGDIYDHYCRISKFQSSRIETAIQTFFPGAYRGSEQQAGKFKSLTLLMPDVFSLDFSYKNIPRTAECTLRVSAFTYQILCTLDNSEIILEKDDEGNLRALDVNAFSGKTGKPETGLIKALIEEMERVLH